MEKISMLLTAKQTAMLAGMFDQVDRDFEDGKPGMLIGQLFKQEGGCGHIEVGYMEGSKATTLLKSLGQPTKPIKKLQTIRMDIE